MVLPNGKSITSPFKMLNFMRKPFDDWLNKVAQQYGAEFHDEYEFKDFVQKSDSIEVKIKSKKDGELKTYETKYLFDATGLRPRIRMQMHPNDFIEKPSGSTLNYYIDGTAKMKANTLYQFWNMEWNDAMFAWVYKKTLDDKKDYWVVGTGCINGKILERQALFYDFIRKKYEMNGTIVKKEGYSSNIDMKSKDRVWLGENNILMLGDAAGLVDQVRGVGMDAAALSGRLAAQAILAAEDKGVRALDEYERLASKIVNQTKANQNREITEFKNNDELMNHMTGSMAKTGLGLIYQNVANKFRNIENYVLIPP